MVVTSPTDDDLDFEVSWDHKVLTGSQRAENMQNIVLRNSKPAKSVEVRGSADVTQQRIEGEPAAIGRNSLLMFLGRSARLL